MPYQQSISRLEGGDVVAEFGPMKLVISAFVGKVPQQQMSVRAAVESFRYLERLARVWATHLLTWAHSANIDDLAALREWTVEVLRLTGHRDSKRQARQRRSRFAFSFLVACDFL